MSSELRRQLREALGPEIKGLQRAVALEIADDARFDDGWRFDAARGRRSKVRLADLVRWTGAKDELSVREMLRRLAVAGWEFRLPIGTGRDGRPLYAVPGVAMQFRVPDFEAPTTVGPCEPEGPTTVGASDAEGPTVVAEGPTTVGEGPTVVGEGPTTVGPPSPPLLPASPYASPSSGPLPSADAGSADEGGGGGDPSFEDQAAEALADSLDYRGKAPKPSQMTTIRRLAAAALRAGWTEQELKECLDLKGDPNVRDAAALYGHRLKPEELPDLQAFREAARRPLGPPARPEGPHRPYQDPWGRVEAEAAAGVRPEGWEKWKHCGVCDEVTRCRMKPDNAGELRPSPCGACHPAMRF